MDLKIYTQGNTENQSIIFIHGFPFDHLMWENQISALKLNYCCVSYDIKGLGESPAGDGQFTMESFVDDLEEVIDYLKLKEPVICGLSMGGYIALRAIERDQNLYKALVLCDTKSSADTDEAKINRAKGIKRVNTDGVKNFVNDFIPNCFSKNSILKIEKEYMGIISRAEKLEAIGLKGCLLAMAGRTDTTEFLSQIKIPTLLICGEDDSLTPPDIMKTMEDKIINSEFHIIKKAGHLSPVENPDEFNGYLTQFLKEKVK